MANIVVTSDDNFVYVQFNDLFDGTKHTMKEGTFKRDHISEVIRNDNNNKYVSVRFDGESKNWLCCAAVDFANGVMPVDSVNGVSINSVDDLYNELVKLML